LNLIIFVENLRSNNLGLLVAFYIFLYCTVSHATTALPFTSDFETGDLSEWDGGQSASLSVTSQGSYIGTHAARAVMTPGSTTDNYQDYYFGDHVVVGGTPPTNGIWLKFAFKFEADFNFGNASFHKIAIVNYEDSTPRRRFQIILNIQQSTGQFFLEHLKWNADRSFGGCCPGLPQNVGIPVMPRISQWDIIKIYIRSNTPGQSDGIVRMWINNSLQTEYTDVAIRQDTTLFPNKLILSNYVTTTEADGAQLWDAFYLGDTDPDSIDPIPKAPVLFQE
jgi:hypothetical protein